MEQSLQKHREMAKYLTAGILDAIMQLQPHRLPETEGLLVSCAGEINQPFTAKMKSAT